VAAALPIEHEGATIAEAAADNAAEPVQAPMLASLRIERGGIEQATAQQVEVRMGGIGQLEADDVFVSWGGVGAARAEQVSVEFGSIGAALADELRVSQGSVGFAAAREVNVEQSFVRTLIAQNVRISRPSAVLVLIAGRVEGSVRPLLDWRAGLAFGAAFGVVSALVRRARRAGR
jgi:hypothetical protein